MILNKIIIIPIVVIIVIVAISAIFLSPDSSLMDSTINPNEPEYIPKNYTVSLSDGISAYSP
jgi:hypothetical protein